MSRTEEISTDVKAVGAMADEARNRAEEALEYAQSQIELAYQHGWDGVAQSISITGEALEKLVAEISGTEGTCENAVKALDAISEQMSHNEVAEQLSLGRAELDTTHDSLQGTVELVDEASQGADQAEHQALSARLETIREELEQLSERVLQARTEIESEYEQADKMGQQGSQSDSKDESRRERTDPGDDDNGSDPKD
jgi:Rad3-related DNA helicase